jgi:precorrin-6Y C5,15-methyltransferase (decarboxylating)
LGESRNKLYIIGTGSGRSGLLSADARDRIGSCRSFAGGRKVLELAPEGSFTHAIDHDLDAARDFIASRLGEGDVCVLTSGDPGCFSILPYLKNDFAGRIEVIPGIAAIQVLAARLSEAWDHWNLISLHGRSAKAPGNEPTKTTVYFCDGENSPRVLAGELFGYLGDREVVIGADLDTVKEELWQGKLSDAAAREFPGNSLLLVRPEKSGSGKGPAGATAPGIPDEMWLRQEGVPLSKSEVRAVLLAKAQPSGRGVIWDVGSGTGSYGIECALLEPRAHVIAIDKKPGACEVIAANASRFGAAVETVCDEAPGCLEELPRPDLAIIGGNDGRLGEIFEQVLASLHPGGRLVVTAFLAETRKAAHGLLAGSGLADRQATRVSIARGKATEWEEYNPVIIFTGDKDSEEEQK